MTRYFRNVVTGEVYSPSAPMCHSYSQARDWEEVIVTPKPKPVSGTVAIIKTGAGVYRAEGGALLINGQHLDENYVASGKIVARLTWTEGEGL